MVTGELRSKVDRVWDAFWSGGAIANPVEVIEQITYLLFIRRLDEIHTREERRANRTGQPMERRGGSSDAVIVRAINSGSVSSEDLVSRDAWQHICRVRGRN